MVNCFLCFFKDRRRKFVNFHSILSSARTVADVVREYFPAVPQNLAEEPAVCLKCYTTLKEFSELVDVVQITHSYPKLNLVKCEAFDLKIKTEPESSEPFETVSVPGLPTTVIEGIEVAEDEFMISIKDEQEETVLQSGEPLKRILNGSHSCTKKVVKDVVEIAAKEFKIMLKDDQEESQGQLFSKPVPRLLTRSKLFVRYNSSDRGEKVAQSHPTPVPKLLKSRFSDRDDDSRDEDYQLPSHYIRSKILPKAEKELNAQKEKPKVVKKTQKKKQADDLPVVLRILPPTLLIHDEPTEKSIASENIDINCYVCEARFQSFTELMEHFTLHPRKTAYFMCCYSVIKTYEEFKRHIKIFHEAAGPELDCVFCDKKFKSRHHLLVHGHQEHSKQNVEKDRRFLNPSKVVQKSDPKKKVYPSARSKLIPPIQDEMNEEPVLKQVDLKCHLCQANLLTIDELSQHIGTTHANNTRYFSCCGIVMREPLKFNRHLMMSHNYAGGDLNCPKCLENANDSYELYQHYYKEHPRYRCNVCGEKLKNETETEFHYDLHRYDGYQFECYKCKHECRGYFGAKSHFVTCHSLKPERKKQIARSCNQCDRCGFVCELNARFYAHMARHREKDCIDRGEGIRCPTCQKVFGSKMSLRSHDRTVHKKSICAICSKFVGNMRAHMKALHVHEERIKCPHCLRYLKSEPVLANHIRKIHKRDPNTKYVCKECGKVAKSAESLWCHVKFYHKLKRELPCRFCPKLMKTPTDVKEHEATHTGIDLYFCEWCPKSFKFGASYRGHRKREHKGEYIPRSESKKYVEMD